MNPNQGQTEAWNGGESEHYVSHADRYDRQLAPFTEALLKHVRLGPTDTVLDIGCGCGVTTLQAAHRARAALGVDISHPLVGIARDRAQAVGADNVEFVDIARDVRAANGWRNKLSHVFGRPGWQPSSG
jgi:cyclopropane fatty-acyl-phospholipid synthase-like methyltransferase